MALLQLRSGVLALASLAAAGWMGGCTEQQRLPAVNRIDDGDVNFFSSSIMDLMNFPREGGPGGPAPEPKVIEEGEKSTLIYPAKHARTEVLREAVLGLLNPDGTIQDSAPLNAIVIQDQKATVTNILAVLEALDKPSPQLLVEARVVEVTVDDDLEYEIKHLLTVPGSPSSFLQNSELTLKTPGANPTSDQGMELNIRPFGAGDKTLDNFIRLLQTKGKANILSSPNLIVAPGTEASIITGEEVPIQSTTVVSGSLSTNTIFKRVGIKLRVTAQQVTSDTARLELNPEVSTVTGSATVSQGVSNPIISLRSISSTLSLKDGETLTVGGLLRDENQQIKSGVPLLQDIPWMGYLFQSVRNTRIKTQLIFFLRVHILPEGTPNALRLHQPGAGFDGILPKGGSTRPATQGAVPATQGAAVAETEAK
jgi:general secretion pathway protein D